MRAKWEKLNAECEKWGAKRGGKKEVARWLKIRSLAQSQLFSLTLINATAEAAAAAEAKKREKLLGEILK